MKRMLFFAVLLLLSGCGPRVSRDQLGTIENELPKFDPIDDEYPLPKLDDSSL